MRSTVKPTAVASGREQKAELPHERDRVRAHMRYGNEAGNDIALFWAEFGADIRSSSGDLLPEGALTTAVILSLFCDARAREDDVLPDDSSSGPAGSALAPDSPQGSLGGSRAAQHAMSRAGRVRGWWCDTVAPLPTTGINLREDTLSNDRLGSRLWLLHREKQLPEVLRRAKDYAEEALAWLITDGEASAVEVTPSIIRQGWLGLDIEITLADGQRETLTLPYPYI